MAAAKGDSHERDDREVRWRAQRRRLLVGPAATWAMSACGSLGTIGSESLEGHTPELTAPPGTESAALGCALTTRVVGELAFSRPRRVVNHLAWSPDGERLAIGGLLDTGITVLDVQSGRQLPAPSEQFGGVRGLAYSPDGRYLAVSRGGIGLADSPAGPLRYTVSLWDPQKATPVQHLVEPDPQAITGMATYALSFSSDARYLAVAYQKETAIYALSEQPGYRRALLLPPATTCAFRPGAASLACLRIQRDGERIVLYGIPDGQVERELDGPGKCLAWSPDGRLLAIASGPHVRVLDLADNRPAQVLPLKHRGVSFHSLSFSADGRWCAAVDHVRLELWETATWSHAATLHQTTKLILAGGFSPRGSLVAAAGYTPVTIWSFRELPGPDRGIGR